MPTYRWKPPVLPAAAMIVCSLATLLHAQGADDRVKISLTTGVDYTTAYYFRGIPQENQDWIVQPYATVNFTLNEPFGPFKNPTLSLGVWNSVHGGPTGDLDDPSNWYELDYLASFSGTIADDLTLAIGYAAYTSPNDAYNTYQEVTFTLSYDDSALLGKFALRPRMLLAIEIDDQADAGNSAFASTDTSEGIYLELGIAPEIKLAERDGEWKIALPATIGLSLSDYYETSSGDDETFGHVDVGAELIVPLDFIKFGTWTLRGGPHLIWINDNAADIGAGIGGGDDIEFYAKLGISVSF